jgi:hypothetical protein
MLKLNIVECTDLSHPETVLIVKEIEQEIQPRHTACLTEIAAKRGDAPLRRMRGEAAGGGACVQIVGSGIGRREVAESAGSHLLDCHRTAPGAGLSAE